MRLLSVSGEGIVQGAPDIALITLGVVSEAKAAGEALAANSQSMDRILTALKQGGIEPRDLQTSGFSVEPIYSQPPRDYDRSQPFAPGDRRLSRAATTSPCASAICRASARCSTRW